MAGAGLLAVPVVVAGAIGFGNSFSGITSGLSAVANGPGTTSTTTTRSASPRRLNDAVAALANPAPGDGVAGGGNDGGGGGADGDIGTTDTGGGGSGGGGSSTQPGSAGGGVPDVPLPPGGGSGGSGEVVGDVLNGVNDTVNGLLGGGTP